MRKLIQPTDTRAHLHARWHTDRRHGAFARDPHLDCMTCSPPERNKPQNFWTRLTRCSSRSHSRLPGYRRRERARLEVRDVIAARSAASPAQHEGQQIVSVAVPIRRFKKCRAYCSVDASGQIDKILRGAPRVLYFRRSHYCVRRHLALLAHGRSADPQAFSRSQQVSRNIAARAAAGAGGTVDGSARWQAFQAMTGALYRRIEASEVCSRRGAG